MDRSPEVWSAEDWQAFYDERAGIMEFDGGLPRRIAEATARGEVSRARREADQSPARNNAASSAMATRQTIRGAAA